MLSFLLLCLFLPLGGSRQAEERQRDAGKFSASDCCSRRPAGTDVFGNRVDGDCFAFPKWRHYADGDVLVLISVTGGWGPKSVFSLTAAVGNGTIAAYASKALLVDHTLVGNPFEAVFICRIIHFIKTSLILRLLLVKTHSAAPTLLLSSSSPREDFILISLSETCCSTIGQIDNEQSLSVWWPSRRRFERSSFGDLSIYWAALRAAGWSSTRPSCPRGLGPAEPNPGGAR